MGNTALASIPVASDACLAHGKRCAQPSVERFSDDDLRNFRRFCGAILARLLEDGNGHRPTAAGAAARSDRS
ncbi:MAG: hypothetical protein AUJ52_03000 [Elusimicrobia bacterium CG1_02_63_36]|nr:MAG: hypothetical protein AUJ52_03000 [Elusimicrobia bacterium CG1_02_63_36]PIP84421.1 MAG: hypothetical protein COR54_04455 [Elusimicrobia bacterium CG22_combo_CG10-13_8_21_14_all_63_91]PJA18277.1 MAG: hypothetical protein COX66_01595 [Elusimicrobia bacterium CG_4_10_14_0_2_um_filter_63_34]PJB23418.1 MAG: hypothetical protein CO113_18435 [Elusimicrobia bacterium CG_4_9_14_3_um_filter_62_55]